MSPRTGQYETPDDPGLESLLQLHERRVGLAIRTATIGTVTAYNPATQEASVRVDMLRVERVAQGSGGEDPGETNRVRVASPTQLARVPVIFAGDGTGDAFLTFPVAEGSTGLLVVLDRSSDTWMARTTAQPVDPVKSAIHSLADCVFIPGLLDRLHRIQPSAGSATGAVLEAPTINLGREALTTTSAAIAERVTDGVSAVLNTAIAALQPQVAPVTGTQVAAALTSALATWQAQAPTMASSKVKVAP